MTRQSDRSPRCKWCSEPIYQDRDGLWRDYTEADTAFCGANPAAPRHQSEAHT